MNRTEIKIIIFLSCFLLLTSYFCCIGICQVDEAQFDPTKRYDEILEIVTPKEQENGEEKIQDEVAKQKPREKDELEFLLPKLESELYKNWILLGEPEITYQEGNELLKELELEKILKQSYKNENHIAHLSIYKFKSFTGAYSAYTALHSGATTKLRVGKNASETDKLINFWKGNYFIDIHTEEENDNTAKEFIILSSQDISNNIKTDQLPPVVAIQLPSLYRVQGSEKYCTGITCCRDFIAKDTTFVDCNNLNLQNSGGIIKAEYQLSENDKDKERITLILTRYIEKDTSTSVFNLLKEYFENKQKENKEIDVDFDVKDSTVMVKNKKDDYIAFKQKGNLFAIAHSITKKKIGEQILGLVPWPIEITKPTNEVNDN